MLGVFYVLRFYIRMERDAAESDFPCRNHSAKGMGMAGRNLVQCAVGGFILPHWTLRGNGTVRFLRSNGFLRLVSLAQEYVRGEGFAC